MKKILLLITLLAIFVALLVVPSSASMVVGSSPYFVANQPAYASFSYTGASDFYSLDTRLPDVIPRNLYTYDDEYFQLGNRATSDFFRWEQWLYTELPPAWNSFTSVEVGVLPFVYRPTSDQDTLPDLEIDFEIPFAVDYQLSYDVRVYTEDGRFVDQYVGGISGTTAVLPEPLVSLSELILQNYSSSYVYLINDYSLKLEDDGRSFGVNSLSVKGNYLLSDTPSPSYELLESPDVPVEVYFEDIGVANIIWNSIVEIFNKPLVGDFTLGAIFLACVAIPLLIMFLKLILGG